ncbi:two-component sensor histidine kinase [Bacillus sp. AFS076308]|uniref:sensor histidine kinase n=1 Tax=unclassified Bacillus (in: firmicutes) TaxID=185979 RepID=UPI000BF8FD32|nr:MULTISPECIES: ATP-binding protein [unclassified Bacillus (in: firmicutes)]PFO06650.1 two-component sensor histidine kinase [Bacillus sp. AFS076308]PGV52797.1 two-component sensor histidine kinase [Bacillus sp. AFS037270]
MKITTKINLLTTVWMLCILMLINFVVYFLFMKTTVNMEENVLFQKAEDIVTDIHPNSSSSYVELKLKDYLTDHSYIRIIQPKNKVIHEVTNDQKLLKKIKGKYTKSKQSQTRLISAENGEEEVLVVRIPIKTGNFGSLEIGERLTGLETRKELLRGILGFCTILATILSLLGGRWLASMIMRPISNMIKTMEEIEKSGVPKKIIIQNETRDELQTMASTFNRMIDRLQENLAKQSQFVSDASHELKTPLTIIKSYANILRRQGLENKDMAEEAIHAIHSEATRIQKMTETFLDLTNLEKENVLERNKVDLVSLSESILKQLKDVYKREIILHFEENPITIFADELKIKQVIIILLDNAIKYSNDKIEVFLKRNQQHAKILIKDYGIGIPEKEIVNIFERFYRVDKARSRETGGHGLGLHIAKSIIKLHKGDIKIKSKEGLGTKVELFLPINNENVEE